MFLALNYSSQAAQLVESGEIKIDFFKTPDWEWLIRQASTIQPVAVHFTLEAGNGSINQIDWNQVDCLSQLTGTPFINVHLDPRQLHYPEIPVHTRAAADIERVYDVMLTDVMQLADHFGPGKIIVENSPYRGVPGNTMRICVEPEIITRLIDETGCGFLLDICHAIISSRHIGMDTYEYFLQLPTHKIQELHFAGIHHLKGQWIDHLSILKADWRWLDWVFTRIQTREWSQPWLLAFEYGGIGPAFEWRCNPVVIAKQVPMLYQRVCDLNASLSTP